MVTAAAAGLFTMLRGASYSVTKCAAKALSEWLSTTHGHRGVTVQVIYPQAVRPRMLDNAGPLQGLLRYDIALEPEQVADEVWRALQNDRFLILPRPEAQGYDEVRTGQTDGWLAGMRKFQHRLGDAGARS